eukprot:12951344-Alexandrium_andersonii.AAC.1
MPTVQRFTGFYIKHDNSRSTSCGKHPRLFQRMYTNIELLLTHRKHNSQPAGAEVALEAGELSDVGCHSSACEEVG